MKRVNLLTLLITFIAVVATARMTRAHEVRPAYLEIRETATDTFDVLFKVPARGADQRLAIYARFPDDTKVVTEPHGLFTAGAYIERWRITRPGGLTRQPITIDGLEATGTDVLVRLERLDGSSQTTRLIPNRASFTVEAPLASSHVAATYTLLGIEHILGGVDHLLYILAMLLLVKGWKRVVAVMTAFTLTHSLTLSAAALGWVHVPQSPVEACIALSILFVAAEIVRARHGGATPGLTQRWPWIISLTFGLLHGFGFAGALSEVGMPSRAIPVALLFFNVGVEIGQLLFIAAILALIVLARRAAERWSIRGPAWSWRVPPYAIGAVAAFWLIQRVALF